MADRVTGDLDGIIGSGKASIASSADDVSIVILVVGFVVERRV